VKGKARSKERWQFAPAAAAEKIAFGLAFRDAPVRWEGGREGGRASPFAEEKRNENVFPDVYRQIENPGRRLCQVRTESGEWPVNGEIGEITWAAGKSTKTRSSRSERM